MSHFNADRAACDNELGTPSSNHLARDRTGELRDDWWDMICGT
jgi:hypothetical protein